MRYLFLKDITQEQKSGINDFREILQILLYKIY